MSTAVLEKLREERDQARDAAIALAEAEDFDPTAKSFTELETRAASLDGQIERLVKLMDARQAADALDGKFSRAQARKDERPAQTRESWGEVFTRSDVFSTYPGRGTSSRVEIETRALPATLSDWADALPQPQRIVVEDPEMADPLLSLVNAVPVSQNAVEYVATRLAVVAGGADVVPEGAPKPPVEFGPPTPVSVSLQNVAVYTQMTRQLLEDGPAVRAMIDNELRREIARKESALVRTAFAGATLPTATGPAGKGVLGAIRAGMADVESRGYQANAFLVSSDDLVDLDIQGWENGAAPYWGLRPIVDPNATAGTVVVGDFRTAVTWFYRSQIGLYITDSHADTFLSNVFTLLAERRSFADVTKPAALSEATAGA